MALSRSQIEILIKARNEAQGAFDALQKQVGAVTGETGKATGQMASLDAKTRSAGVAAQATGVAFGLLAERVARGLVTGFQNTITAANRLDAGLIGLGAQAKSFGVNVDAAQDAAKRLAADGLMTVGDAAAGLKNLLGAGFGLPEATTLMMRFKDSAAFGRQGSLEFGQAIVGATEGIKNGNSALVDNAGVTKNLSVILQEAGFSANDLQKASSDVNVRMAIFNGLLKETNPQLGNTALYLESAAGKQAQFNSQMEIAQQKIGKALQPALASALVVLQPFVQTVGEAAPVLVPLAAAVGAVAIPLAAMRAAAALGIPSIAGVTKEAGSMLSVFKGVTALRDFRAGIQLVGESAGLTTAKLGPLGTAASVAAAAFVGWQVGTVIDQLTGLSGAVETATVKLFGLRNAQMLAQNQQDVIAQAIRNGAAANITYAQAAEYNSKVETIRQAAFNKSAEAQRAAIAAELELGRITQQTANERLAAVAAEQRSQDVARNRISLSASIATAEKQIQDEIRATGMTVGQLVQALRQNEDAFKRWAEQNKLSADTVKFLEDRLKAQADAQKRSREEADRLAKAQDALLESLRSVDLVTRDQVVKSLADLAKQEKAATDAGLPLDRVILALNPTLQELAAQAKNSGIQVDALTAAVNRSAGIIGATIPAFDAALINTTGKLPALGTALSNVFDKGRLDIQLAEGSLKHLGITSQVELQALAGSARLAWERIVRVYGEKSPEATAAYREMIAAQMAATTDGADHHRLQLQLTAKDAEIAYGRIKGTIYENTAEGKRAYQAMIDAQRAATGTLPSAWDPVFASITGHLTSLATSVASNLGSLLFGFGHDIDGSLKQAASEATKTYLQIKADGTAAPEEIARAFEAMTEAVDRSNNTLGERFAEVWRNMKTTAMDVLNDILGGFVNSFMSGMIGAMRGQQGAFSKAFAGFLGGPGGGLGAVGTGGIGAGSAGASATPGGLSIGTLGGSLIGAGAGGVGGFFLGNRFGTAAGIGGGVGAGALTGALLGGPIGAGVGALAGLLGGLVGGSRNNTKADREAFAQQLGVGNTTELWALLQSKLPADQAASLRDRALGQIGRKDTAANTKWMEDVVAALEAAEKKTNALSAATERYGLTWEDMDQTVRQSKVNDIGKQLLEDQKALEQAGYQSDAVLRKQAKAFSDLYNTSKRMGTELPDDVMKVLERLREMGLLLDENGNKVLDLSGKNQEAMSRITNQLKALDDEIASLEDSIANEAPEEIMGVIEAQTRARIEQLRKEREAAQAEFDQLSEDGSAESAKVWQEEHQDAADEWLKYVTELFKNGVDFPVKFKPEGGGSIPPIEGGAAGGVMANRPGLVLFGEGGEPEVGGPVSFFQKVFDQMGLGKPGGGGFGGGGVSVSFGPGAIQVLDAAGLENAVVHKVIPAITKAVSGNKRATRTALRAALGVK